MTISVIERPDIYDAIIVHYSCERKVGRDNSLETDIVVASGKNYE